jgi:hypothetical protein
MEGGDGEEEEDMLSAALREAAVLVTVVEQDDGVPAVGPWVEEVAAKEQFAVKDSRWRGVCMQLQHRWAVE